MRVTRPLQVATTVLGGVLFCLTSTVVLATPGGRTENPPLRVAADMRFAQSGSMGGTIGNREKSLSGSRDVESERPARQKKSRKSQRDAPPRRSNSGGNFDGTWTVVSRGCSGAGTGSIVVADGRIVGQGVSGSISSNGTIRSVANLGNGGVSIGSGRASGRTASGIYRQTDGCTGRFTAVRN